MTAGDVSFKILGGHRPPLQSELSEARRLYPEARIPAPARRNRLEFLVKTLVSKVHGVGDTRHGFESDEVRIALAAARDGQGDPNFIAFEPMAGITDAMNLA